jgi:hypothetical protein
VPDARRGVPRQPFYYTLDQVAAMLSLGVESLCRSYVFHEGVDVGLCRAGYLRAVRISAGRCRHGRADPDGTPPFSADTFDWRVAEGEFIRWLTHHGLWIYPDTPGQQPLDPTAADFDTPASARAAVAAAFGASDDRRLDPRLYKEFR